MTSINSSGLPSVTALVEPRYAIKATGKIMHLDTSTALKMTDAESNELKLWEAQTKVREEVAERYAGQHPDKVYGQVVVNGKPFATVYDSGGSETPYQMPGMPSDGSGSGLAEARLAYIAKATGGKVIRSNFFPTLGGSYSSVPESELPRVTVRSLDQILQDMIMRSRIDAAARSLSPNENGKA